MVLHTGVGRAKTTDVDKTKVGVTVGVLIILDLHGIKFLKRSKKYMLKAIQEALQQWDHEVSIEFVDLYQEDMNDNQCIWCDSVFDGSQAPIIQCMKIMNCLENSGIFNAGKGSCLNENGSIETEWLIASTDENFSLATVAWCEYYSKALLYLIKVISSINCLETNQWFSLSKIYYKRSFREANFWVKNFRFKWD